MPYFMKKAREPISSYTHFLGAILFGSGAILLFLKALAGGDARRGILPVNGKEFKNGGFATNTAKAPSAKGG